jgi:predicted membrane chloride channel (bestrophin family)
MQCWKSCLLLTDAFAEEMPCFVLVCYVCRHTSRFLLCYIHCLPLLLWPLAEWGSPVLAVMISFLVLGIEGISSYIEEPFHVSRHS